MDDAYSPVGVGEALYAELDRESVRSGNPSYQNTAYSQCGEVIIIYDINMNSKIVPKSNLLIFFIEIFIST